MALTSNLNQKQVDLPVWEWLRAAPVAPTAGLSCTCVADNSNFNSTSGRYMYYLANATNFWRYDTWADSYEQMASPPNAPLTATSMRYAGSMGYYNRVIAATSTTIDTGLPSAQAALGYKIRIVSGKGAGQERIITGVSDPIVVDTGSATTGTTASVTDTAKAFITSYTGTTANANGYVGYMVRLLYGTGLTQTRKILFNSAAVLTVADFNLYQNDVFAGGPFTVAPAAGTIYQIEYNRITVDTAWTITPDNTSRFVIQSGGIWLFSGAAATPFYTVQYYDVLHDIWYTKSASTQMVPAAPTEMSVERVTENASIWYQGSATGGSTTTLDDSTAGWTTNQWQNYYVYIYSGTGLNQIASITSNTSTTLTISSVGIALAAGSQYQIVGFDAGTSSGTNTFNTFNDSTKSWAINRWKNYAVRILSGTGAGQLRTILSNTSTALTLYKSWNIIPDNTSIYAIQGDSDQMYLAWGGIGEIFIHNGGNADLLSHGRVFDQGVVCVGAALLSDSSHTIYEQMPFALSAISGTTTITASTVSNHNFRVGQYVSIRGITAAAADQYNVGGLFQITSVPSVTTFTYTPVATGSGTYTLGLTALATTALTDASRDYRDNTSSATTTSITFPRITPTNINGWYVTGTNVAIGTRVSSGAGTATITLSSTQALAPSGVIVLSQWAPTTNFTATGSGGGAGVATVTLSAAAPAGSNGWYISGTGIPVNTFVFSGQGTTSLVLSNACSGAVSGTVTLTPSGAAGKVFVFNSAAPVATTGLAATQLAYTTATTTGSSVTFAAAAAAAPSNGISRYLITGKDLLGAGIDSQNITYYSGVLVGTQSTTTAVDTNTFWATATGSAASAGLTTITLSAIAPGNVNGWYISGTGITLGTYILSGAGTTTLTLSKPTSAAVSGTMTCTAWNQSIVNRRLKYITSTGITQDVPITSVAPTTGTLGYATALAGATGSTVYSIYSLPTVGTGCEINWVYGNSVASTRGKYLWVPRCGGANGINQLDITSDRVLLNYYVPIFDTLTTGTYFAYDGQDKLFYQKDATLRFYYMDVNTHIVQGGGTAPYLVGTAQIGNKMDIFTTADGLKYLVFNRHGNTEMYRMLIIF